MRSILSFFKWLASQISFDSRSAWDCINEGNACYHELDYDGAIASYSAAIQLERSNANYYCNRAAAWLGKLEYDRAIADYSAAIQIDPKCLFAFPGRAMAWHAKKEFDRAVADFTRAIQFDPSDVFSFVGRGNSRTEMKEYELAFADYDEAIHLDPKSTYAYCCRGVAWGHKAILDFVVDGAVQLDHPSFSVAQRSRAQMNYDRAIEDFSEALRIDPTMPIAYFDRGGVWHWLENYQKAIEDYTEAIRLEPNFVLAYTCRGHVWRDRRQYQNAIDDFEAAMRIDPKDVWSINGLAWLLGSASDEKVRDGKRAVELAKEVLQQNPTFAAWMDTLGVAYAEAGDFEEAIAWQEKAVQNAPPAFEAEMRRRLELYRNRQPYRQPERRDDSTQFMERSLRQRIAGARLP